MDGRVKVWLAAAAAVTVLGAGAVVVLNSPQQVPAPPGSLVNFDCVLVSHASAWVDLNSNGVRDLHERPLSGVRFELDDVTHHRSNVAKLSVSEGNGTAVIRKDLPGCPAFEFQVRAVAPAGFGPTTPLVIRAADEVSFGFAEVH